MFLTLVVCCGLVVAYVVAEVLASLLCTMMYSVQFFCIFCMLLFLQGVFVGVVVRIFLHIPNMDSVFVEDFGCTFFVCLSGYMKLYFYLCCLV